MSAIARHRRGLQIALGVIWLIDAALQYQPYMFSRAFVTGTLEPIAAGNPWIVAHPMLWADHVMIHHIVVWNALYATIQLVIALGLLWRPAVKYALAISVGWSLAVWWLGEGLGGILTNGANPFMGGPGAVVLYGFLAVVAWPRSDDHDRVSVAESSRLGRGVVDVCWMALWGSFAYFSLVATNRAPQSLHEMVLGMATGEPGWVRSMDRGLAAPLDHAGLTVSIVLAVVCVAIAVAVLVPPLRRPALAVAIVFASAVWLLEDFGAILTSQGTDVNSGPLLVLMAWAYWPVAARVQARPTQPAPASPAIGLLTS
jgi:hypothetical protein